MISFSNSCKRFADLTVSILESRVGLKIESARNLDDFYLLVTFENDYTLELDCNEASASLRLFLLN